MENLGVFENGFLPECSPAEIHRFFEFSVLEVCFLLKNSVAEIRRGLEDGIPKQGFG